MRPSWARFIQKDMKGMRVPEGYGSHGEGFGLHSKGEEKPVKRPDLNGHRDTSSITESVGRSVTRCRLAYIFDGRIPRQVSLVETVFLNTDEKRSSAPE